MASAFAVEAEGHRFRVDLVASRASVSVFVEGRSFGFGLPDSLAAAEGDALGGDAIIAPMPGLVKLVSAAPGARVAKGDPLLILEAMKMEHTLAAPRDGVVAEVLAAVGDQVTDGTLLLALEPEDG